MNDGRVSCGVERLRDDPRLAEGARFGLVTNHSGVLPDLTPSAVGLLDAAVPLTALFGPEHGIGGTAQAGASEPVYGDPASGLPVYDTYRRSGAELDAQLVTSDVDTVLYDLQDVGARFYTYVWTMYDLMLSAARTGRRFVVLDRPNPIGGVAAEGPGLDPAYASFVGRANIPIRHGLSCGELARFLVKQVREDAGRDPELAVVPARGWRRSTYAEVTGLPWVPPSPNMPTPDTAVVYPGTCLFEGTNLSEGRGSTRPFELIGAPYVDASWVAALRERGLPGVLFRDVSFVPAFGDHAGAAVRGVQLHVTDRSMFAPVRTSLTMLASLRELYPEFGWREDERPGAAENAGAGEEGAGRYVIDLLWGNASLRETLDAGGDPLALLEREGLATGTGPADWVGEQVLLYR